MFIEYPKMKTLFKLQPLDEKGKKWSATTGEILPDTAALHYFPMEELIFTEKIDGTNMAIRIDNNKVTHVQKRNNICNKEDNNDQYYFQIVNEIQETIDNFEQFDALANVIIYGELCGVKIQNGGNYFPCRKFLIFDIFNTVENKFFTWEAVQHFTSELKLETVPQIQYNKENLNVENVKDFVINLQSVFNDNFKAEGFVVRHNKDTSFYRRWMAKIRSKDFKY